MAPTAPSAVSKTVANVPTGKADAADAVNFVCTASPQFNDMPDMSVTFRLGGTASRPALALFQGTLGFPNEGAALGMRLTVDGVVQSGPSDVTVAFRPPGEPAPVETHGFNFISDPLAPGIHTAKIQWHDNGVSFGCARDRGLIVLHK